MVEYGCPEGAGNKKGRHARTYTTGEDNMQKFFNRKRKGFSMVEILIVLVILAIISGGGMMIAGRSSEKAKFVTAQKDLDVIQQAFIQYYNVKGSFTGLTLAETAGGLDTVADADGVLQSFFGKLIDDFVDPWQNQYQVMSDYDAADGSGSIVVFCSNGDSTAHAAVTVGGLSIAAARTDTLSNEDNPTAMFRIVYNVAY
jgi:prepilin-type N-terminal cleavage/methylation domain-containing protein